MEDFTKSLFNCISMHPYMLNGFLFIVILYVFFPTAKNLSGSGDVRLPLYVALAPRQTQFHFTQFFVSQLLYWQATGESLASNFSEFQMSLSGNSL